MAIELGENILVTMQKILLLLLEVMMWASIIVLVLIGTLVNVWMLDIIMHQQ